VERLAGRFELLLAHRPSRPLSSPAKGVAVELGNQDWVRSVAALRPRVVIHAAALTDVDFCQRQPALALEVNRDGTRRLAEAADPWCERFIYCSTDLVFDGGKGFYRETDTPRPLMVYGESKLAGERELRARLGARALIVRLALLYGLSPSGRENFCQHLVREGRAGRPVPLSTDQFRTPLYIDDAARGLEMLVTASDPPACLHLAGPERLSRHEMGLIAARVFGFDPALASPRRLSEAVASAPRPADVSLDITLARSLGFSPRGVAQGLESMRAAGFER
jgi:dTDP-4-dehydrorhamnose reductase